MDLESYIREKRLEKKILIMTHLVMGYPSFTEGFDIIRAMVESGVDLIELQIPCADPLLDGPIITRANRIALENSATVSSCLKYASEVAHAFRIPCIIMSYSGLLLKYGKRRFISALPTGNLKGAIIPDMPVKHEKSYATDMKERGLSPVFVFSPEDADQRMRRLASLSAGFVYCKARKGVTGDSTRFNDDFDEYFRRCRQATRLPFAVGFGIKRRRDIDTLTGKADIAVIGTKIIEVFDTEGILGLKLFLQGLL